MPASGLPSIFALRDRGLLVLVDDDFRYGGSVWPAAVGGRRQLWRLADSWYAACPERESLTRLGTKGDDERARRAAIEEFGGFDVDMGGRVVPMVHDERDARWHAGTVYVRDPDGPSTALPKPTDPADLDHLLSARVVWSAREERYALTRGKVFVPSTTTWCAVDVAVDPSAAALVGRPASEPDIPRDSRCFVLLTSTADPAEPLWRALSRLVWAAWRAPSLWRVVRSGPQLRHPPAVAVSVSGHRTYGILAASPEHAAEVADAFGIVWVAWCAGASTSDAHGASAPVAVVRGGRVVGAGVGAREPAVAPAEGDALWDDEQFAGGRFVPGAPPSLPDAVAEMRSVIAAEERLRSANHSHGRTGPDE